MTNNYSIQATKIKILQNAANDGFAFGGLKSEFIAIVIMQIIL